MKRTHLPSEASKRNAPLPPQHGLSLGSPPLCLPFLFVSGFASPPSSLRLSLSLLAAVLTPHPSSYKYPVRRPPPPARTAPLSLFILLRRRLLPLMFLSFTSTCCMQPGETHRERSGGIPGVSSPPTCSPSDNSSDVINGEKRTCQFTLRTSCLELKHLFIQVKGETSALFFKDGTVWRDDIYIQYLYSASHKPLQ